MIGETKMPKTLLASWDSTNETLNGVQPAAHFWYHPLHQRQTRRRVNLLSLHLNLRHDFASSRRLPYRAFGVCYTEDAPTPCRVGVYFGPSSEPRNTQVPGQQGIFVSKDVSFIIHGSYCCLKAREGGSIRGKKCKGFLLDLVQDL